MNTSKQLREYIKACEHMIKFFNKMLNGQVSGLAAPAQERLSELTELRMEVRSPNWPEAEPWEESPELFISQTIKELVRESVEDKTVLDFGSHDPNFPRAIKINFGAKHVVSYDVNACQGINTSDTEKNLLYTENFKLVKQWAPFDVIILNDIIDHMEKPVHWLSQLGSLTNKGKIYARCHPMTSRNGTHLSEQINKAFLHLVFSEKELSTLGVSSRTTRKILDGSATYRKMFDEAGLKVVSEDIKKRDVEMFFLQNEKIAKRMSNSLGLSQKDSSNLLGVIETNYIDYELKPKDNQKLGV